MFPITVQDLQNLQEIKWIALRIKLQIEIVQRMSLQVLLIYNATLRLCFWIIKARGLVLLDLRSEVNFLSTH